MAALTAARTWTLPDATDTLVGKATTDTLTNKTLTAPTLSGTVAGTPTFGGAVTFGSTATLNADPTVALQAATKQYVDARVPTITLKKGSGAGNYTTTSSAYVDIDATNLAYAVTVPTGQKVLIAASLVMRVSASTPSFALTDATTVLVETDAMSLGAANVDGTVALNWVFTGDGATHTFKLRFKISDGVSTLTVRNASATAVPVMTFWLGIAS